MPRHPFHQLPRARQDEILDVAGSEFARFGFQGTSYNRLLERLHLGKSSAYYYFQDKRDLFLTVIARFYATYFASIAELDRPTSPRGFWTFVGGVARQGFEFMSENPTAAGLMQCMYRERVLHGELMSLELLTAMNEFYDGLIAEGQRLGAVRADIPQRLLVETVRNIAVGTDQWFISESQVERPPTADEAATLLTDLIRRVIEMRPREPTLTS